MKYIAIEMTKLQAIHCLVRAIISYILHQIVLQGTLMSPPPYLRHWSEKVEIFKCLQFYFK